MSGVYKDKIYRKLHHIFWHKLRPGRWSLFLYPAYWRYRLMPNKQNVVLEKAEVYLTQEPNKGAGIGHQMGNWNAGYWFAQRFGVKYAYSSFSNPAWDEFLGFGEGEITAQELLSKGYKKRRLPYFDEKSENDMQMIQGMIDAYRNQKVVFFLELDQFYEAQYGAMEHIKQKFHHAQARNQEKLIYQENCLNIAVHIRRGDIVIGQTTQAPGLTKRWLTTEYSANVVKELVSVIPKDKPYQIYVFSQGMPEDFPELNDMPNLTYCLDMSAKESFLHMVKADILVTSKSSFSYKPALLSDGIKICPPNFWHGYPEKEEWIVVDNDGTFTREQIQQVEKLLKE